jgi:hypothetical protein
MKTMRAVCAALVLLAVGAAPARVAARGCLDAPEAPQPAPQGPTAPAGGDWRAIEGTWSASGSRRAIATESGTDAHVLILSGAVVLTSSEGVSRGFRGELVAFDDGTTLSIGRVAWTDDRGDRLFGAFKGTPLLRGRALTVTLTGGTGRYTGITGELTLTWQYVVNGEDETIQVRTTTMKGRYQFPGGRP